MCDEETIYRKTPLPKGDLRGKYFVTEDVFQKTRSALINFALAGINDGGHEGIVFWAGRESPSATNYLMAIVPQAEHSALRVNVSKEAFAAAARYARSLNLGILGQIHSHPGKDVRHSEGDDSLVILPFEGMLSLVAPKYGVTLNAISDFGVHQFQGGRWVLCSQSSVNDNLIKIQSCVYIQ